MQVPIRNLIISYCQCKMFFSWSKSNKHYALGHFLNKKVFRIQHFILIIAESGTRVFFIKKWISCECQTGVFMNRIQNRSFPVEGITDPCTLAFSSIYSQLGIDRQFCLCVCVCVLIYTVIRTKMTFKYAGFLLKKLIKTIKRLYWFFLLLLFCK